MDSGCVFGPDSVPEGQLAAFGAVHALGRIGTEVRDRLAASPQQAFKAHLRIRPFLDALYRPPDWITAPQGETIVCRCEEVTAIQIADMVKLGCLGPQPDKIFSRCGLGPCQGRICGLPVAGILARELHETVETVGAYRIRAPLKPVPLEAIAQLHEA